MPAIETNNEEKRIEQNQKHKGKKTVIETAEILNSKNGYYIRLKTPVVQTITLEDGTEINICASKNFGLADYNEDTDQINWIKDAKLSKFLQANKISETIETGKELSMEVRGIEVMILLDRNGYLTFD